MSKYYKAFNTLKGPITHLKNVVSSSIGKKGKVSPTIKSVKPKLKRETKMGGGMMGRRMNYKKGSKFPDLTGDGKVTFADILKGRGVINGKKKGKA
jgi:hypothetical protein